MQNDVIENYIFNRGVEVIGSSFKDTNSSICIQSMVEKLKIKGSS